MSLCGGLVFLECYRFGFNGKENDRHEWGNQLIQDYGFRLYNPAIGKFLSVDLLAPDYPWYTPYQFAGNMPIWAIDLDGLEEKRVTLYQNEDGTFDRSRTKVTIISRDAEIYQGTQRVAYTHLNIILPDGNVMSKILVEKLTDDGKLIGTIITKGAVDQSYEVVSDFYPAARYDYTSKADDKLRYSEDPTTWGKSGNSSLMFVRNEENAPEHWQSMADFYGVVELGANITQASNFLFFLKVEIQSAVVTKDLRGALISTDAGELIIPTNWERIQAGNKGVIYHAPGDKSNQIRMMNGAGSKVKT